MDYVKQLFEEMYANQYNRKHLLGMRHYLEERPFDFENYIHNALTITLEWYIHNDNSDDIKQAIEYIKDL